MTCQLRSYDGSMSDTRWLDERQQRAWRAYLAMQAQLQAQLNRRLQADAGMSLADFDVLVALTDRGDDARVRVLELAEVLQWEKSRLSHHLARMERRGLIQRQECTDDGRGAFVVLTTRGRYAIEHAAPPHAEAVRSLMFDGLETEEVETLARIADTVTTRVRNSRTTIT
jgi:DNA-binding MarR family transcriptional regulator